MNGSCSLHPLSSCIQDECAQARINFFRKLCSVGKPDVSRRRRDGMPRCHCDAYEPRSPHDPELAGLTEFPGEYTFATPPPRMGPTCRAVLVEAGGVLWRGWPRHCRRAFFANTVGESCAHHLNYRRHSDASARKKASFPRSRQVHAARVTLIGNTKSPPLADRSSRYRVALRWSAVTERRSPLR